MLRWEKTCEVLCLLIEGQQLRNAIRAEPRTRLWTYCDLSPDCRAIEQFGMGVEYAGIEQFFAGLEGLVGVPAPEVRHAMAREHAQRD